MELLRVLGEHAKVHAGAIAARLEDEFKPVREAAVDALRALGEHAKDCSRRAVTPGAA